jgi:hypothetical protein
LSNLGFRERCFASRSVHAQKLGSMSIKTL